MNLRAQVIMAQSLSATIITSGLLGIFYYGEGGGAGCKTVWFVSGAPANRHIREGMSRPHVLLRWMCRSDLDTGGHDPARFGEAARRGSACWVGEWRQFGAGGVDPLALVRAIRCEDLHLTSRLSVGPAGRRSAAGFGVVRIMRERHTY